MISLGNTKDGAIQGYSVAEDHQYEPEISLPKAKRRKKQWAPLFFPKDFWKEHLFHKLDQNELSKKALKVHAKNVTESRKLIVERACRCADEELKFASKSVPPLDSLRQRKQDLRSGQPGSQARIRFGLHSTEQQGNRIRSRGSGKWRNPNQISPSEYMEKVPIDLRKCRRAKNKIQLTERIELVHQVICLQRPLRDVAKEH